MKKLLIMSILICTVFITAGCGDANISSKDKRIPDISKADRLSYCIGNDELFTKNKDIINGLFPENCIYTEKKDYNEVYYGCPVFHVYNEEKLLYDICVHGDNYICINGIWYSVENPPDYQEIAHLIQEENED